jgi:hypothetical protein
MATMGQPAKYTLCFAERSDGPFPTFTERHGLGKDESALTAMGISGTAEVLPGDGEGATPEAILDPVVERDPSRTAQSSQSMTTGSPGSGVICSMTVSSCRLLRLRIHSDGTLAAGTDRFRPRRFSTVAWRVLSVGPAA